MDTLENNLVISVLLLGWACAIVGVPLAIALLFFRRFRPQWRLVRTPWRSAWWCTAAAYGVAMLALVVSSGFWRGGIVAAGQLADGREYCVVQTFQDLSEPFRVTLYVRTDDGAWRSYYLEHEADGWRSAEVELAGDRVRVKRDGVGFRDVAIVTRAVDLTALPPEERVLYQPATLDRAEIEAIHRRETQHTF